MLTCFFENKSKGLLRHVTVEAIVVKNKQILLGKRGTYQGKPMLESGKWGLMGGFLTRDENLIQGIRREVKEESGWEIDNLQLFRINDNPNRPKEDRQNVEIIFIAEAVKQVKTSDEEVTELKWFALDKLPAKELIAFDHHEAIELYLKYLQGKIILPILG